MFTYSIHVYLGTICNKNYEDDYTTAGINQTKKGGPFGPPSSLK